MSEHDLIAGEGEGVSRDQSPEMLPSVGLQLQAGREAKGMTVSDAAKVLKLSVRQVEALESDDWAHLPGNTIARGFVRNYARLLGLDASSLMHELDRREVSLVPELDIPVGTNVRVPQEGQVEHRDYIRVVSGMIVLILALLAYFFVPPELWHTTLSALKSATQSKTIVIKKPATETPEVRPPAGEVVAAPAVLATETAETPQPSIIVPESSMSPTAMAAKESGNGLRFNFTQPSWVEVRDRSGEVVFSQLCQAGSEQNVDGQAPFAVIIGNASSVTLTYKGKPVDLSKRSKDDVARVTVE